jgi:single-stranded-DNA-specific exonuclease
LAAKDLGFLMAGGGHAMAAGITIDVARIDAFTDWIEERLAKDVGRARDDRAMFLDAVIAPRGISPELVEALEAGGPYGAGWPAPRVAAGPVRVIKADIVGNRHVRAVVSGADGHSLKTIAFSHSDSPLGQALLGAGPTRSLWIAGRAKIDEWSGRRQAELHLEDAAWAD